MVRQDVNRSGEMEVFARVVELGGFSAAARAFRMTPSAVSKLVARLETRLGVRLINRSTRKLQLTPEGTAYYDRSIRILDDINTAEREAAIGATPRGRVRVNTSVPFGLHWLLPLLPGFLKLHPGVSVDVALTDTVVDLMEERADIAIRVGPLRESRLLARKLGESRMVVVAAPGYLADHGTPRTPADLAKQRRHRLGATGRHRTGLRRRGHATADRCRRRSLPARPFSCRCGYQGGPPCAGARRLQSGRSRTDPCGVRRPWRTTAGAGAGLSGLPG